MANLAEPTADLELARPAGALKRADRPETRERTQAKAGNSLAVHLSGHHHGQAFTGAMRNGR